ncbi:PadR family transcriptional regulator [Spiroplasma culicicola]|uniref:PadR family transcriptional regulator, regulatory protein PadR n=1 Tax=Spiroplasma culicicola AES-1 TaxID=1276246 RepID=W6A6N4_9MOLU|nr:PadR family transcriptional regulator [Spiroplasma culicicola]AHI52743.1 PadR family transcriptional regulator, regulatory protein PadR [Spiroplasma culicicola AES-1]
MIILDLLRKQDYYAYELNKILNKFISINESTAYAIFKKLVDKGFVSYYLAESNNGPVRKYYKITKIGLMQLEEYLKNWEEFINSVQKFINENK